MGGFHVLSHPLHEAARVPRASSPLSTCKACPYLGTFALALYSLLSALTHGWVPLFI